MTNGLAIPWDEKRITTTNFNYNAWLSGAYILLPTTCDWFGLVCSVCIHAKPEAVRLFVTPNARAHATDWCWTQTFVDVDGLGRGVGNPKYFLPEDNNMAREGRPERNH